MSDTPGARTPAAPDRTDAERPLRILIGADTFAPDVNGACPPPDFAFNGAVDVVAHCRRVLGVADARLGLLHWPVTDVRVRWSLCPPGARCVFLQFNQGWVIYRFAVGDPAMIHVGPRLENDVVVEELVADAPEPLPDWLLEELEERDRADAAPAS